MAARLEVVGVIEKAISRNRVERAQLTPGVGLERLLRILQIRCKTFAIIILS